MGEGNRWSAGWSGRYSHSSLSYDGKMWVLGGFRDSDYLADVWYSTDGKNWQQATNQASWFRRGNHTSLVFDNKMWVLGGPDAHGQNGVWFSTDGANWQQVTSIMQDWSASLLSHTSLVYDNKMWVLGGTGNNDTVKDEVHFSDMMESDWFKTNTWLTTIWPARQANTCAHF